MNQSIHLPGLNGLRAIAALSVMWGHVFQSDFGDWGIKGFALPVVEDGVTLFFVISGFLITYLLLNEQQKSNTVSIPKFYMRRVLRIWPIYYLYLIIAVIITNTWHDPAMWYYGFFAANVPFVLSIGIWPIVHYWSIGVEEQFYLFWPWVVKLTKGRFSRLLYSAVVFCFSWLLCKWGSYLIWGKTCIAYRFFAVTRFDCMMIGAIGAILYYQETKWFIGITNNRIIGMVCLLLLMFSKPWAVFLPSPVRPQIIALLSLFVIMSQLAPRPIINLENKLCDSVGKISYGIYVIHPLLIYLLSNGYRRLNFGFGSCLDIVIIYCGMTIITYLVAWLSYRFFESPFLKLKNKFAIIQSSSSMR
jgi:peptidoglycan/LPS O-acetylase OafA/YrhL